MGKFEAHMCMMRQREKMLTAAGIKIFRLSTTERQEFKECRRRWDYSSLSRQGIEPTRHAVPLWFGTGIHHALEMFYMHMIENKCPPDSEQLQVWFCEWYEDEITQFENKKVPLTEDQQKELLQHQLLATEMLDGYARWSLKQDARDFAEILYSEQEFAVVIPDENGNPFRFTDGNGQVWELWLVGRLDVIGRDHSGKVWVMDHKTSKDKLNPEFLVLDDQMTVYSWAAQIILQERVEGCLYNVLRKKVPRVPQVLKSGKSLSKDKSIDTTYEIYLQAIIDNGFDPNDYSDILDLLSNKQDGFFQREKVYRNQHELAMAGRMLVMEAIDMLNDPYIYPNPTWDCTWKCDYRQLCLAFNRNDDHDYLKEVLYQPRSVEEGSQYERETTNG